MRSLYLRGSSLALAAAALAACNDRDLTAPARPRLDLAAANAGGVSVARDTLRLISGGRDSVAVRVARPADVTDAIALAVDSLPTGLTATVAGPAAGDTTALLTVAASDAAAPGAHRVVVRASAGGRDLGSAELVVVVRAAPPPPGGPADAAWAFCDSTAAPVWLAYQEGDGPWARVAAAGSGDSVVYRFTAKGRGGVALVTPSGDEAERGYELAVYYGTAAELAAIGQAQCAGDAAAGGKSLTGSVAGLDMAAQATVSMGGASAAAMGTQPTFTLRDVAAGPQDLVAALTSFSFDGGEPSFSLSKLVIRRGLDLADGATIPALDFAGDEAFAPASAALTVDNAGASRLMMAVSYATRGGASAMLFAGLGGSRYYGVPAAKQAGGDLHTLTVMTMSGDPGEDDEVEMNALSEVFSRAFTRDGAEGDGTRAIVTHFRDATDRTIALGPELATPAVTPSGEGGRWQARVTRQAEYSAGLVVALEQEAARRRVTITTTEGYVGAAAAWEPSVPDLAAVDGFDARWAPRADAPVAWTVSAFGGDYPTAANVEPADGTAYRFASRSSKAAAPGLRSARK